MANSRGKFTIASDVVEADRLSGELVNLLPEELDARIRNTMRLGLKELLINAVEHGNLEVSFAEKTRETDKEDYLSFLMQRQKLPAYADRKVAIEYHIGPKQAVFRISDQGKGFDHQRFQQLARYDSQNETLAHGRGIKMTLRIFDRVRYNAKGNRVTLVKKLTGTA